MTTDLVDVHKLLEVLQDTHTDTTWDYGDDLCDCTFQRIGFWTNPYLGATLRVRICCLWAEIYRQYPQLVQEIPAHYNLNTHEYEEVQLPWDSTDSDMPRHMWYRQVALATGKPLAQVREELKDEKPPKAKRKEVCKFMDKEYVLKQITELTEQEQIHFAHWQRVQGAKAAYLQMLAEIERAETAIKMENEPSQP